MSAMLQLALPIPTIIKYYVDGDSHQFNKTRKNTKCINNGNKEAMPRNLANTLESNIENPNTATKKKKKKVRIREFTTLAS